MCPYKKNVLTLFFIFPYLFLIAQDSILFEDDFTAGTVNWITGEVLSENGVTSTGWRLLSDNRAAEGEWWGDRPSLPSAAPCIGVNLDDLFSFEQIEPRDTVSAVSSVLNPSYHAYLTLDNILDFSDYDGILLSFNQFFREIESTTTLDVTINDGSSWEIFEFNQNVNISITLQGFYPASYLATHGILSVASVTDEYGDWGLSLFSNFSNEKVNIGALGANLWSTKLGGRSIPKSGTSLAAATVSGTLAELYCSQLDLSSQEKVRFLFENYSSPILSGNEIDKGRVLEAYYPCIVPLEFIPLLPEEKLITLFPNPAYGRVQFEARRDFLQDVQIIIFDLFVPEKATFKYNMLYAEENYLIDL